MNGSRHRMHTAFPSAKAAKRYNLNKNHHVRVWCECMADQIAAPGSYSERPASVVAGDPRRLGGWDWLGVADVRVPNSALDLYRAHLEEASRDA